MYDPSIHKIEVLRLEKRLDNELLYLRDALPEYSTFDPDMQVELLSDGKDNVYLYCVEDFSKNLLTCFRFSSTSKSIKSKTET